MSDENGNTISVTLVKEKGKKYNSSGYITLPLKDKDLGIMYGNVLMQQIAKIKENNIEKKENK